MAGYRSGYGRRPAVRPGRVERVNARAGECRSCGEMVPAGGGQLWREPSGAWSVTHVEQWRPKWHGDKSPITGGCPAVTDSDNAAWHAAGMSGKDAVLPAPESERIAARAARYVPAERPSRSGGKYAYTSTGARMTVGSRRCEDAPCCGCCD